MLTERQCEVLDIFKRARSKGKVISSLSTADQQIARKLARWNFLIVFKGAGHTTIYTISPEVR